MDDGDFVCTTAGTSPALVQWHLSLKQSTFFVLIKVISIRNEKKKRAFQAPRSSSACLAGAWTRADNSPQFYWAWLSHFSCHKNGTSSLSAQWAWESTLRVGAPLKCPALTWLGFHSWWLAATKENRCSDSVSPLTVLSPFCHRCHVSARTDQFCQHFVNERLCYIQKGGKFKVAVVRSQADKHCMAFHLLHQPICIHPWRNCPVGVIRIIRQKAASLHRYDELAGVYDDEE